MIDLKGKLAVISGGARDIGQAVVVELARCGADVAFTYHQSGPAETLKALKPLEVRSSAAAVDALDGPAVRAFVAQVVQQFGRPIDILVNVAGGLIARRPLTEMDETFWDQVIDLNLKTTFLLTTAALAHLKDGGAIVNFSSQAARDGGGPGALAYATAKGAITTFTRGLAKELGPRRIRANCVCPGMVSGTFHNTFTKPEVRQRVAAATPLGREGQAVEVAKLVAYLASDAASFVNGAAIDINGGIAFS
jgi:3-oxoacyl-[acyl-carrier protein] reductase